MTQKDREWLEKCIKEPGNYKIYVDNDEIFVVSPEEFLYSFTSFGEDFIVQLLKYLGTNVSFV